MINRPLCCGLLLLLCYVLSAERARPYLLTTDAHASTDYINAVYIDVRIYLVAIRYPIAATKRNFAKTGT